MARAQVGCEREALARHFPGVGRRVGHGPLLEPLAARAVRLLGEEGPILNVWRLDEAARVLLLLEDARREAGGLRRASELYFRGDGRERIAVLRSLELIPGGDEALPAVRDALRQNAVDLFAAAICENDYASRYLPDELFCQAVLKCVFVGLHPARILRVEERATPELSRMLFAYVTEREHAGRSVPPEVWPLIALHPPPQAAGRPELARASGAR